MNDDWNFYPAYKNYPAQGVDPVIWQICYNRGYARNAGRKKPNEEFIICPDKTVMRNPFFNK